MDTIKKMKYIVLITILGISSCFSQTKEQRIDFNPKIIEMKVMNFKKPITIGFGQKAIRYQEALELKLAIQVKNYDNLKARNNMPLLFIGNYQYHFIREEKDKNNQITLVFHIPNWKGLKDNMPVSYTYNHQNPHKDNNQLTYNIKLIKK